jgi:hypothetical protein
MGYFPGVRILRTKKTPRGMRGLRVIVVVAKSVFTSVARLCWILLLLLNPLLLLLLIKLLFFLFASSGFDVWLQMSNLATARKNLFLCAANIKQDPCQSEIVEKNQVLKFISSSELAGQLKCL